MIFSTTFSFFGRCLSCFKQTSLIVILIHSKERHKRNRLRSSFHQLLMKANDKYFDHRIKCISSKYEVKIHLAYMTILNLTGHHGTEMLSKWQVVLDMSLRLIERLC
jgi:hypothetical protein